MKCFIITLFGNPESVSLAEKCYASAQMNGYQPSLFQAYNGKTSKVYLDDLGIEPIKEESFFDYERHLYWSRIGGTRGCFASHFNLWQMCLSLNENIIILEHDSLILRPWPYPVWTDVLHLDYEGSIRRRQDRNTLDTYNQVVENSVFNMGFKAYEYGEIISMNCTYSYAITPSAARKLIDETYQMGFFASDRFMREPIINIDTIHPKIAEEQPEAMDIKTTSLD